MGIRQAINGKSPLFIGLGISLTVLALIFVSFQWHSGGRARTPEFATRCFYTTDDGNTLFADSISNISPFEHSGIEAVRAYVFSCDGGKHRWVQYLEKYTEAGRKSAEAFANGTAGAGTPNLLNGLVVKRPGATQWVQKNSSGAGAIVIPTRPDGMGSGMITEVYP